MRKHEKSVDRRIAAQPRDQEAGEIGSEVFSLRGPPVSVPSVGTRRSTRVVFVPKNVSKVVPDDDDVAARVLRSGKRLVLWKPVEKKAVGDDDGHADAWMQFFGSSDDTEHGSWWKGVKGGGFEENQGEVEGDGLECRWHAHSSDEVESKRRNILEEGVWNRGSRTASVHGKAFGIVYSRKRQRSESDGSDSLSSHKGVKESADGVSSLSDGLASPSTESGDNETQSRRFGIVFVRKPYKKPKVSSTFEVTPTGLDNYSEKGRDINKTARDLAEKVGVLERDLWLGLVGQTVLVVLMQPTSSASAYRFTCFLVSILSGMMKKKVNLFKCAAFMSSRSVARVFSLHGIHFLPVGYWKSDFSRRSAISDAGICIIFGARLLIPLVTANFPALPFFFKSLHLSMSLGSLYLPSVLVSFQRQSCLDARMEVSFEECRLYASHTYAMTCASSMDIVSSRCLAPNESNAGDSTQALPANKLNHATGSPQFDARNTIISNNVRCQKNQRKRSSLRSDVVPGRPLSRSGRKNFVRRQNSIMKLGTGSKVCPTRKSFAVESVCAEAVHSCLGENPTEHVAPSGTPNQKKRGRTTKNSIKRSKELKSAFAEVKQNIDELICTANILVMGSDRCWREEGAKVLLELSNSDEWCLAVKSGDTTRYLHKAQEMKPSATNRYTHAMMWTGDSGWKLEFCHKKDWNVFKELHKECCERNLQVVLARIIPVPGVRDVSGYEEDFISSFVHPDSYIHMVNEVERVLTSESACYDMDSEDEEWLEQLNVSIVSEETGSSPPISEDNFEKIVSAFEKAAYSHPDDVSEVEKAAALCSNFGGRDIVAAVFEYWFIKRQKRSPLVRVFQGQPPRKTLLTQRRLLRKKRSLKRQGSHAGRGKPEIFLEAAANQDAIRKCQEAEADASRAADIAIQLRCRAQTLMINADLAAYKSVMVLRLAESLVESGSPDLSSVLG